MDYSSKYYKYKLKYNELKQLGSARKAAQTRSAHKITDARERDGKYGIAQPWSEDLKQMDHVEQSDSSSSESDTDHNHYYNSEDDHMHDHMHDGKTHSTNGLKLHRRIKVPLPKVVEQVKPKPMPKPMPSLLPLGARWGGPKTNPKTQ
jgi:hypothetical protein